MDYVEKTARTVDEAITEALIELGVTSDQVNIEVLDEGAKGIFGFLTNRPAKVKVSKKIDPEQIAVDFLEQVFDKMNLFVKIEVKMEPNMQLAINLSGEHMGILIGKRGHTLDSLQYLISLVVNKETNEYIRVKLDTEEYRSRRKETLEHLAINLAKKVKSTGRKVALEPMNPYERRIIHATLQQDKSVHTHSEGDEPYRRVIITSHNKDRRS